MRYAIYFTPGQNDPLTRIAASWLGRDPFNSAQPPAPVVTQLSPAEIAYHTASARRYGFHATLKAPFHLAEGETEAELDSAIAGFAAAADPILLSKLTPGADRRLPGTGPGQPRARPRQVRRRSRYRIRPVPRTAQRCRGQAAQSRCAEPRGVPQPAAVGLPLRLRILPLPHDVDRPGCRPRPPARPRRHR